MNGSAILCFPLGYPVNAAGPDSDCRTPAHLLEPDEPLATRLCAFAQTVLAAFPLPDAARFDCEILQTADDRLVFGRLSSGSGQARVDASLVPATGIDLDEAAVLAVCGDKERLEACCARAKAPPRFRGTTPACHLL